MKLQRTLRITLVSALTAVCPLTAAFAAAKTAPRQDIPAALAKEAKITLAAARTTALAKVPKGKVTSEELERENGKLIYTFDIQVAGRSGVEEVNVDAIDGKVVGVEHESARTEKQEEQPKPRHRPPAARRR